MRKLHIASMVAIALLLGFGNGSHVHASAPKMIHENEKKALEECSSIADDSIVYATAAGFKLEVPSWMLTFSAENAYGLNCELKNIKLHFAWVEGSLIPIPKPGFKSPRAYELPTDYEVLTLMISFTAPSSEVVENEKEFCRSKRPVFEYLDYHVVMCPYLMGGERSPNIKTLPFYPRFELTDGREVPVSFTCSHSDLNGYTVENVYEVEVPYSCRGYWHWRPGASAMFDLPKGKVVQNAYSVMRAAEQVMNSWVLK